MDTEFIKYLEGFISEERQSLFKEVLGNRTRHVTLVLEDLFQKHNVSAIIRSADIFGVQDLHVIENEYNSFISRRVAKGAQKWMTFHNYSKVGHDNTQTCIDHLKSEGYQIIATTPHNDASYVRDFDISKKTAVVMGVEKRGVSEKIMNQADGFLKVPMFGFTESLNVSVAAALILEELTFKLRESNQDWGLTEEDKHELYHNWLKTSIKSYSSVASRYKKDS
jgi:tRNA (guanosine-2'-O-)-methyltransferase